MSTDRTIARLWRDAVARERTGAAYLVQHGDHWHAVTWAGGGRAGREPGERPPGTWRPQGRVVRDASPGRRSSGRCSTSPWPRSARLRTPVYPNSSPHDTAYILEHSESVGVLCENAGQAAERRGAASVAAAAPARAHLRRPPGARSRGRALPRRAPVGARRGGRRDRRGRPVHAPVHVGDDRPAQGLHDPAPQLLRDGVGDRPPPRVRARRRPDAAVPAAGPQLRAVDAPHRPVRRLHDRLPPRSPADGGRIADGAPHRPAERPPGVREDPHGRRRRDRRDDGCEAAAGRLVAPGREAGRQAAGDGSAGEPGAAAEVSASQTGSSSRRSANASGDGCGPRSPGARRSSRRSPSSSMRSASGSSRVTASASARRLPRRTRTSNGGSGRSAPDSRASSSASRRTAS